MAQIWQTLREGGSELVGTWTNRRKGFCALGGAEDGVFPGEWGAHTPTSSGTGLACFS